jgi:hypothetical protein
MVKDLWVTSTGVPLQNFIYRNVDILHTHTQRKNLKEKKGMKENEKNNL